MSGPHHRQNPIPFCSRLRSLAVALGVIVASATLHAADAVSERASQLWQRHVLPTLDKHCTKCHGPLEQKSGLEVDSLEALLKGGDEGPALVPGKPQESPLYTYLAADADPHMPPKKQLSSQEISWIQEWVSLLGNEAAGSPEPAKDGASIAPLREVAASQIPAETTQGIDFLLQHAAHTSGQPDRPLVSEPVYLRRLTLDLAGRLPTPAEQAAFDQAPAETRRADAVDRLLASADFAKHWRSLWDVVLMTRSTRREDRRRDSGWFAFLEDAFAQDRAWNEVLREIIVARPSDPSDPKQKGVTWFLYERKNQHQQMAEAIAPLIYGTRLDCAQCHDHPLAREIKQGHYWGLVAAFNRSKNIEGGPTAVAESAVGGFINFTNLKKESQPAVLALLSGKSIPEDRPAEGAKEADSDEKYRPLDEEAKKQKWPRVPVFSRREALAQGATQGNPLLAQAFVNHVWAMMLGRGIVHPVDEINSRTPALHPQLLRWLGEDFAQHGYRPKHLIRAIALSRVYREEANPQGGPLVQRLERPLTAEQLATAWSQVIRGQNEAPPPLRKATADAFPHVLIKDYSASFQQAQFLHGHAELMTLLTPAPGSLTDEMSRLPDSPSRVQLAFTRILNRQPSLEELAHATLYLTGRRDDPQQAAKDLAWSLMTSAEFLMMP